MYFVGDRRNVPRWVVKQPDVAASQEDLPSPIDATQECAALVRLFAHFSSHAPELRVPRPIALLPEVGAFAMEYVHGRDVAQFIGTRALAGPQKLLHAMALAARFVKHLHAIDGVRAQPVDLGPKAETALAFADEAMAPLGLALPRKVSRALANVPQRLLPASLCRLHGDFAPVNVFIDPCGSAVGIDPRLDRIGYPEEDLARFLTMFATERWFVATQAVEATNRLRVRAESALLAGYYGCVGASPLLELCRIDALTRRWVRREAARQRGRPVFGSARARVVDAHFRALLIESARRLNELL